MNLIESFSPLGRRLIALGLLAVLLLVLMAIVGPVATQIADDTSRLADLRFRKAQLEAIVVRAPPPPMPGKLRAEFIVAPSAEAAAEQLRGVLQQQATAAGIEVQLTPVPPDTSGARPVAVIINGAASEEELLKFINGLEQGHPLVRFRSYRITAPPPPETKVSLTGEAVAGWRRP